MLKLAHNRETEAKDTVPSRQQVFKDTYPALMNRFYKRSESGDTYIDAKEGYSPWALTNFDKSALRKKHGK